jgi:hypothetical protein
VPTPLLDNRQLGPDVARANLLTNGGFEIWQRGNGPYTVTAFCADRWGIGGSGGTLSITKETGVVDVGSRASLKCVFGYTSSNIYLQQLLTIADGAQIRGRTFSYSIRVNSTVVNTVQASLTMDGTGAANTNSLTNSVANAWQTLTVTAAVPLDATVLAINLNIQNASCTAYIDNAMLVVGSQPCDYVPLHPADDLARCLRYYERVDGLVTQWIASAAGNDIRWVRHTTRKAVTPTVTKNGTWTVSGTGQPSVGGPIPDGFYVLSAATGAGNPSYQSSDATMFMSSEANP